MPFPENFALRTSPEARWATRALTKVELKDVVLNGRNCTLNCSSMNDAMNCLMIIGASAILPALIDELKNIEKSISYLEEALFYLSGKRSGDRLFATDVLPGGGLQAILAAREGIREHQHDDDALSCVKAFNKPELAILNRMNVRRIGITRDDLVEIRSYFNNYKNDLVEAHVALQSLANSPLDV